MKSPWSLVIAFVLFGFVVAGGIAMANEEPSAECVAEFERVNISAIEAGPYKAQAMTVRGDISTVVETRVVEPPNAAMIDWPTRPASTGGSEATLVVSNRGWTRKNDGPCVPTEMHEGYFALPRQPLLGDMPQWIGQSKPYWDLRCEPDAVLDGITYRVFSYVTQATSHHTGHSTVYTDRKSLRPKWQSSYRQGDGVRGHGRSETVWQEIHIRSDDSDPCAGVATSPPVLTGRAIIHVR